MALLETRFRSETLKLSVGASIILPDPPEVWTQPPAVLYLLHGLSDDHTAWCRQTSIERYAANYPLAIVMPEVHRSFYCDMAHGSNYWNFIADELPLLVKRWFNLSNDWKKTFVAGLSMGGYGAMKLALDRPGQYATAASLSGALDIAAHIHDEWDEPHLRTFEAVFGKLEKVPNSGNDLIAKLQTLEKIPPTSFHLSVGTEDFLYPDSRTFRDAATQAGLNLVYEEDSGDHDWAFWDARIQRVLDWLPIDPVVPAAGE